MRNELTFEAVNRKFADLDRDDIKHNQMLRRVLWIGRDRQSVYDLFDSYMSSFVVVYGSQGTEKKEIGELLAYAIKEKLAELETVDGEDHIQTRPEIVQQIEGLVPYDGSPEILADRVAMISPDLQASFYCSTSSSCKCTSTSSSQVAH